MKFKMAIIGTGYVGSVTGACFTELGYTVTCIDSDEARIEALATGILPFHEPGLSALVRKNLLLSRLAFSTDLAAAMNADFIFICVGTPPGLNGVADLSQLTGAVQAVAQAVTDPTRIVINSTVPEGTNRNMAALIRQTTDIPIEVLSNPEFLREGSAIPDFRQPDRVVIGAHNAASRKVLAQLYEPVARGIRWRFLTK